MIMMELTANNLNQLVNNLSDTPDQHEQHEWCNASQPWSGIKLSLVVGLSVCSMCSTLGNLLVIVAFCVEQKLRTNFNIFLLNLAITDLLISLTAIPFYTIDFAMCRWPFSEVVCGLWIFMDWGMTFASIFTIVAISVDRYWAACWSIHYRAHNSQRRTLKVVAGTWVAVLVVWVPSFIRDRVLWSEPHVCMWKIEHNRIFSVIVSLFGYHIPSFLIMGLYIKVVVSMWRLSKEMSKKRIQSLAVNHDIIIKGVKAETSLSSTSTDKATLRPKSKPVIAVTAVSLKPDPVSEGPSSVSESVTAASVAGPHSTQPKYTKRKKGGISRREKKIFSSLSVVVIAYLVCWAPFHVLFDVMYFWPEVFDSVYFVEWYTFTVWMCYMNSALNPILYAFANRDFRRAFWKLLTCLKLRRWVRKL